MSGTANCGTSQTGIAWTDALVWVRDTTHPTLARQGACVHASCQFFQDSCPEAPHDADLCRPTTCPRRSDASVHQFCHFHAFATRPRRPDGAGSADRPARGQAEDARSAWRRGTRAGAILEMVGAGLLDRTESVHRLGHTVQRSSGLAAGYAALPGRTARDLLAAPVAGHGHRHPA